MLDVSNEVMDSSEDGFGQFLGQNFFPFDYVVD